VSSGPSGPSVPRSRRHRRGTELTVSAEGLAALDALWAAHPGLTRPEVAERAWLHCQREGIALGAVEASTEKSTEG
jgi:hypothetical protein